LSTLGQLLRAIPSPTMTSVKEELRVSSAVREAEIETADRLAAAPAASVREEQIHSLVHQLFLQQDPVRVRNVCFAPVEASATSAHLCLEVAQALAIQGRYDVGLIDTGPGGVSLQQLLQVPAPHDGSASWQVAPSLWLVPHEAWTKEPRLDSITDRGLGRLRDFMAEFDFSVLPCAPVSWGTMRIAQYCDGLVLILTANKTRRLVATQVKEQLAQARIPLLGTVLADRRLPVPEKLYQVL